MNWFDTRTGRRWQITLSSHGNGWLHGQPVRLLWFAREREFWSTECYLPGPTERFSEAVLQEHLARAKQGWYQGIGTP